MMKNKSPAEISNERMLNLILDIQKFVEAHPNDDFEPLTIKKMEELTQNQPRGFYRIPYSNVVAYMTEAVASVQGDHESVIGLFSVLKDELYESVEMNPELALMIYEPLLTAYNQLGRETEWKLTLDEAMLRFPLEEKFKAMERNIQ